MVIDKDKYKNALEFDREEVHGFRIVVYSYEVPVKWFWQDNLKYVVAVYMLDHNKNVIVTPLYVLGSFGGPGDALNNGRDWVENATGEAIDRTI